MDFIEKLIVSVIVLGIIGVVIIPLILMFTGLHYETGKGEHTGFVTAIERDGIFWKTATVYFKTDTSSSQEDEYCVTDNNVYARLEEASRNKEKITVQHNSYFATAIYECNDEPAIIYNIK